MRSSSRASWDLSEGKASLVATEARRRHADLVDLTESNPTRVGLSENLGLAALVGAAEGADRYEPDSRGVASAREAVAGYYRERGYEIDPSAIVLTASTSEAYAWLFKLVCDPGDEVLVPTPSYPLFSYLAALESVVVTTYPLVRQEAFRVDAEAIARAAKSQRARAIVVVAPNNPTGTLLHTEDARAVEQIAREHGLVVIADEVFGDYVHAAPDAPLARSLLTRQGALTFVLSGLSKVCCAPGLKLGWIAVTGPRREVDEALARLEVIADTFLSVSTPVQRALPAILGRRAAIQRELSLRIETNRAALARACEDAAGLARVAPSHGGWTSLLEIPRVMDEDAWVEKLALDAGVLVQPGYFFEIVDGGTLAVSLIVEPEAFEPAVRAITRAVVDASG